METFARGFDRSVNLGSRTKLRKEVGSSAVVSLTSTIDMRRIQYGEG